MRKFLRRLAVFLSIGALPFVLLIIGYICNDPLSVIRTKTNYSGLRIPPHQDFLSTAMFDQNHKRYHYNSFIFGSSRTMAYRPDYWKTFLESNASPFVFVAPAEVLKGIYWKIKYIDRQKVKMDNVLLIICRDHTFVPETDQKGVFYLKHPETSGMSWFDYHKAFFEVYMRPKFLWCYYNYSFTHKYKPWMRGYIEPRNVVWDSITNELRITEDEERLVRNPDEYYKEKDKLFYPRKGETIDSVNIINQDHIRMMKEMVQIFKKQGTRYKVILSPLYEQARYSATDLAVIKSVFGNEQVYDFTGGNWITNDKRNFYEQSHYRKHIGDTLMKLVYVYDQHTIK